MSSNTSITKSADFLPPAKQEIETDFNYTRENLYRLIEQSMRGIEDMAPLAEQAQNARVYEVFFNAIKTTAELNEKLVDHSIKKEDKAAPDNKNPHGETINQNLFVGSGAELLEVLESLGKNKKDGSTDS